MWGKKWCFTHEAASTGNQPWAPHPPAKPKGLGCPFCTPSTRAYLYEVTMCGDDVHGMWLQHAGASVRAEERGRWSESEWWGCIWEKNGVGESQRRAKRRAVKRGISEDGERKTKQKVSIQKARREIKKIHPARNSTSCHADKQVLLGEELIQASGVQEPKYLYLRNRN